MKHIKKQAKEPATITEIKSVNGTFDDLDKEQVQNALLEEQGYLCAYCMRRISREWNPDANKWKIEIEHYKPQEKYPEKALDYSNMLGVCNGTAGEKLHCDKTKGGKADGKVELKKLNPLDSNCETMLQYLPDGTIQSVNGDAEVESDLDKVLNLNDTKLKEFRADAIEKAWREFQEKHKKNKGSWTKKMFQDEINRLKQPNKKGRYTEYCQCLIYFFEKKLKRAQA
ncbi:MAG: TIGR02646 family protein [Bacteroidetes bacterium]|nr:MAG: TIGR02646 family protein [Bacteroidota bacterium]